MRYCFMIWAAVSDALHGEVTVKFGHLECLCSLIVSEWLPSNVYFFQFIPLGIRCTVGIISLSNYTKFRESMSKRRLKRWEISRKHSKNRETLVIYDRTMLQFFSSRWVETFKPRRNEIHQIRWLNELKTPRSKANWKFFNERTRLQTE